MRVARVLVLSLMALFAGSRVASASPITWNFSNILFPDGTTVTGSFVYDANTNTFSGLNMTTAGGTSVPATSSWFYNTLFAGAQQNAAGTAGFLAVDATGPNLTGAHLVSLFGTSGPLFTNAGGTIPVDFHRTGTCANAACDSINFGLPHSEIFQTSGAFVTGTPVPEPTSLVLLSTGVLGAVAVRRRVYRRKV